jgi:hypothetical protein
MLNVSPGLLRDLSRLLAAERRRRSTPALSRKLTCRDQALLALRWFRDRIRIEALGRDHGVSRATAYRYVAEAVDVLSAQALGLPEALERAMAEGSGGYGECSLTTKPATLTIGYLQAGVQPGGGDVG